ncbi:MAG TPA: ADOP family duplicated permease [Bryobacteraceae bacterium]|jgi:predicted permease
MSSEARRWFAKFVSLFGRGRAERDLSREIDAHLALLQEDFERGGLSTAEAALAARRAYGGVEQTKELHRAERSHIWLEQFLQDLHHSTRALLRTPGFTLLAVMALGLGIGVNTALFTAYNAVALKPLPVADPDHVVRFERWVQSRSKGLSQYGFSYREYIYSLSHTDQFSSLVAASWTFSALAAPSSTTTERRMGQLVSANYFADLGIPLRIGRGFLPQEDRTPGGNPVAVISSRYWQRGFGNDPSILGHSLKLNGTAFTVIGVTPEDFTGTTVEVALPDFWAPLSMQAQLVPGQNWLNSPQQQNLQIFARLKPLSFRPSAQAQADLAVRQLAATYIDPDPTTSVTLQRTTYFPNTDDIRFRALVGGVMLLVGLVLLVACANVGNMLLARGASRQCEISTRMALGASRARVLRQLLSESILLALLGGAAGLSLSVWSTKLLSLALQRLPWTIGGDLSTVNLAPDGRVLLYVLGIAIASGILFGLSPALRSTRRDLTAALKDNGTSFGNLSRSNLRSVFVAAQVAVSALLLATAGLLSRGVVRSQAADPGFETRRVFTVAALFGGSGDDPAKTSASRLLLRDKLRELPELASVSLGAVPLSGTWTPPVVVGNSRAQMLTSYASDGYFETLQIPLRRGRVFSARESLRGDRLAVITESTARNLWPTEDALGKIFSIDIDWHGTLVPFEVIGIVKDVRFSNLTRPDPGHIFLTAGFDPQGRRQEILARIQGDRNRALSAIAAVVERSDKNLLPGLELLNLDEGAVELQRTMSRTFAVLAAILAALAVALAGLGIYGVIAYLVSQRTREIGIRMALGANSAAVWKDVILQGLRPVVVGMLSGLTAAAVLSALLHQTLIFPGSMDFLYGVPFYDPATFSILAGFILAVAGLASAVPAFRALRVDPAVALRYE